MGRSDNSQHVALWTFSMMPSVRISWRFALTFAFCLHSVRDSCLGHRNCSLFFRRSFTKSMRTLLRKRGLSLRKCGWFDLLCSVFNGTYGAWELSPSRLLACLAVPSSDASCMRRCWRVKLCGKAGLRGRLSCFWILKQLRPCFRFDRSVSAWTVVS